MFVKFQDEKVFFILLILYDFFSCMFGLFHNKNQNKTDGRKKF